MERVVITGIGLVTPNGIGTDATWRASSPARAGIAPITLFDASTFSTALRGRGEGLRPRGLDPEEEDQGDGPLHPARRRRRHARMKDAGIELTDEERDECGTLHRRRPRRPRVPLRSTRSRCSSKGPSKHQPVLHPARHREPRRRPGLDGARPPRRRATATRAPARRARTPSARRSSGSAAGARSSWSRAAPRRRSRASASAASARCSRSRAATTSPSARAARGTRAATASSAARARARCCSSRSRTPRSAARRSTPRSPATAPRATRTTSPSPRPSGEGAQRAMRMALEDAQARRRATIDYVNAHGTSTPARRHRGVASAIATMFGDHAHGRRSSGSARRSP